MKRKIRSAYSGASVSNHPTVEKISSRVKQEFKKRVDINEIISRMKRGQMPPSWMTAATPRYGDFTKGPQSLMEAFDVVARAEEAFASLPLEFRRAIDHDPRNMETAPYELYEKFGLTKAPQTPPADTSPSKAAARPAPDQNLANEPLGTKKAPPKGGSQTE